MSFLWMIWSFSKGQSDTGDAVDPTGRVYNAEVMLSVPTSHLSGPGNR